MRGTLAKSLAARQAARAVLAACLIGLSLSILEVAWATWRERGKAAELSSQMLDLLEGGAATAAWNVDEGLAEQIGLSALSIGAIDGLEILLTPEQPLWQRFRHKGAEQDGINPMGRLVFDDLRVSDRLLYRPQADGHSRPPIGVLRIHFDMSRLSADYIAFVTSTLLSGLLRNLLLGLALTLVFHRFLTRPLLALEQHIAALDSGGRGYKRLPLPPGHEQDELGRLTQRINETLERLDNSQDQLRQLATRDPLTGLPNRALLQERLDHALSRARRGAGGIAVLFLDLDRFKTINDSLGHEAGDKLLRAAAQRLSHMLRGSDTVGRLGGDEFLVIVEEVREPKEAIQVADRILMAIAKPLEIDSEQLQISASIGIGIWPGDGEDAACLLRSADIAMYAAKAAGGAGWRMFSAEMSEKAINRLQTEARLRAAELREEFVLFYQPKVSPHDLSLLGAEALLRWRTERGFISPAEFIPVAEETGLIIPIGEWVLREACRQASQWRQRHGDLNMAVNVSPRQLADSGFADKVRTALALSGLPPALLTLEITETAAMNQASGDFVTLHRLREIGVGIAMDDFGTGYSSLSYLRRIPLTELKIDRTLMATVPGDAAIAATILELGLRLGLEIVAEGVETEEQRAWLSAMNCQTLQGFLVSPPVPASTFEPRFLADRVKAVG
ncbi:EAL domain-containing protein [Niveispirillum sp. SYP-B3756]|uniref:putative bifunctional diguanylate cyclase/phosphodiesterase n=1 Tax=Niveispirillum sp. SYP-B3756 TaxID=2662178 RepID=UPI0012921598|nr:EAL domain-containing protein [Niveispirillum sp. SYP-B3756]MQP65153.1 EAL domain-containing protein [Niveispirillum sp. SYP-B3756]